ncbi:hypothetical protein N566_16990 [Streptomycetaceae bacterium MP113-05]|nr:hypothetical protein N566_16990 [Streptomycetaceae bacterium MP113-05]
MKTIIHRIRLHEGVSAARFEEWVREVDYAACPGLPSVEAFGVHRVPEEVGASHQYVEIISVESLEAFERDMKTAAFHALEVEFDTMAEVVDETTVTLIEPGYAKN